MDVVVISAIFATCSKKTLSFKIQVDKNKDESGN